MPTSASTAVVHVHKTESEARLDAADLMTSARMTIVLFEEVTTRVTWDNNINQREDVARRMPAAPMWLVVAHR